MKKIFSAILIFIPLFSSLLGTMISNFNTNNAFFIEKICRDPLLYFSFFILLLVALLKMRLNRTIAKGFFFVLLISVPFVYSVFIQKIAISASFKVFRECLVLIIPLIIGFKWTDSISFRRIIVFLSCVSILFIVTEIVFSPYKVWSSIGFTNYYLKKQNISVDLNWKGDFKGHKNEKTIKGMYENYDSFGKTPKVNRRYGGLIGEPIEFGHVFAFFTIYLLTITQRGYFKKIYKFLFFLLFFFGLLFIKTKGYLFTVFLYIFCSQFIKNRKFRFPMVVLGMVFAAFVILLSIEYNLSSLGHLTNLMFGLQSIKNHVLFGSGFGSTIVAFDDSFVAKLLVEGGGYSITLFLILIIFLMRFFIKRDPENLSRSVSLIVCTFTPLLLTGAAIHLIAIYLNLYYIGILMRETDFKNRLVNHGTQTLSS